MTMPKGTDMRKPITDELFDKMTAGYSPEMKACKRAGLNFLNSIMALNITNALSSLAQMRKSIEGISTNLDILAFTQSFSETPADINRPVGDILNDIAREREAKDILTPKSKAEHESRNFETMH